MKLSLKTMPATTVVVLAMVGSSVAAQQDTDQPASSKSKPNPLNNVYFGEQHLHTNASVDAFIQGNHKNSIEMAFRYNMGEVVEKFLTGEKLQHRTPYDWTAVTDHAEHLGILTDLESTPPPVSLDDPIVVGLNSGDAEKQNTAFSLLASFFTRNERYQPFENKKFLRSAWQRHVDMMKKYNIPGKFTTLIGFEWTSMPNNQNLHRNVFFGLLTDLK